MFSPAPARAPAQALSAGAYAELFCLSNFSFQRGASHPEELVERAHALGYAALALSDECSASGVVRAHLEAKKCGLKLLPGACFTMPLPDALSDAPDAPSGTSFTLIALPRDMGDLCEFITTARRSATKGQYKVRWPDPAWTRLQRCEVVLVASGAT